MNTDAGTSSESTSLSDELAKAAELLKSKGLDHAATHLLAPETAKTVEKEEAAAEKAEKAEKAEAAKGKLKVVRAAPDAKTGRKARKAKSEAKPKTAKAKTAKATKKVATVRKPKTGQSGPRIAELGWEDLNKKERLVLGVFDIEGEREVRTIEQMGAEAFQNQSLKKQNSWTRNSLRRIMRSGIWLEKTEPGKYRLTQAARTKLRG